MMMIGERSMLWRTTFAVGALALASVLGYLGLRLADEPQHAFMVRILASALLVGACACVLTVLRVLRGRKNSAKAVQPRSSLASAVHEPRHAHR
jgi:hypothetical protein